LALNALTPKGISEQVRRDNGYQVTGGYLTDCQLREEGRGLREDVRWKMEEG